MTCCRETEMSGMTSTLSEPRPMVVRSSISGNSLPLRGPATATSSGLPPRARPLFLS
jgi:hypothetical protein